MKDSGKLLTAVLAGAAAGLIAGLLFAPDKGSETRRRLADGSRRMADNVKDYAHSGMSGMSNLRQKLFGRNGAVPAEATVEDNSW